MISSAETIGLIGNIFPEVAVLGALMAMWAVLRARPSNNPKNSMKKSVDRVSCEHYTNSGRMDTHVLQFNQRLQLLDVQVVPGYNLHDPSERARPRRRHTRRSRASAR